MKTKQMTLLHMIGTFRKKKADIICTPHKGGWKMSIRVGGKSRMVNLGKYIRPCWTVACKLMDEMWPTKQRARTLKESKPTDDTQTIKLFGA